MDLHLQLLLEQAQGRDLSVGDAADEEEVDVPDLVLLLQPAEEAVLVEEGG